MSPLFVLDKRLTLIVHELKNQSGGSRKGAKAQRDEESLKNYSGGNQVFLCAFAGTSLFVLAECLPLMAHDIKCELDLISYSHHTMKR